jgi:hypothetical protein
LADSWTCLTGATVPQTPVEQRLHKDFVRTFENAQYDEESIYYVLRESMMVRPMTVYGRQLSIIRTSCNDNSVDQYEHVHLSLKIFDRKQDIKNDGLTMTYNHLNSVQTADSWTCLTGATVPQTPYPTFST